MYIDEGVSQTQGKSVLRKSRSTSTLDSSAPQQVLQVSDLCDGVIGPTLQKEVTILKLSQKPGEANLEAKQKVVAAGDGSLMKNLHMTGDKKQVVANQTSNISISEAKNLSAATTTGSVPARKQATPSSVVPSGPSPLVTNSTCNHGSCCPECAKSNADGSHQHHVHVKRPATGMEGQAGTLTSNMAPITMPVTTPAITNSTLTPASPSAGIVTSGGPAPSSLTPSGPPLVPSQVRDVILYREIEID